MSGPMIGMRLGEIEVLVEAVPVAGSEPTSRIGDVAEHAREAFTNAQDAIVEIAASVADVVRRTGTRAARPDCLEVEFGLKFSAHGQLIIAGAAGEASLTVRMKYSAPPKAAASEDDG